MLKRLFTSKKFLIGISCLALSFAMIFLRTIPSGTRTVHRPYGYSVSTAAYTPSHAESYSIDRTDSLKEKVNRKIDRVIGLIDEILD